MSRLGKYGMAVKGSNGLLHEVVSVRKMVGRVYITYVWNEGNRILRVGSPKSAYFKFINRDGMEFTIADWNEHMAIFVTSDGRIETTNLTNTWVAQFHGSKENEINFYI